MGITETNIRKLLSVFGVNQVPPQTLKGVKGILDTALPPVPFTFSALVQPDAGGAINGINYILPKLDIVSIPNFISGAMENWGLITFREEYILLYDKSK